MGSESDGAASGPAPTSTPASDPAPSLVDWDLARKVAAGALILKPAPATYRTAPLQSQFDELTARAEFLVTQSTGLKSAHGAARAKVVDRAGWATANVRSMQRLVGSALTVRETDKGPRLGKHALAVGQVATGTQLGLMLAYMATRVLGQYDLLISEEDPADQDLVSYVGPNVTAIEERYGFAPNEFRLWLALHEVTHRMQFTAVPWLRDHFVALVSEVLEPLQADPQNLLDTIRRVVDEVRAGHNPLRENGVAGIAGHPGAAPGHRAHLGDDEPARGAWGRGHGPGRRGRGSRGGRVLQGPPRSPDQSPGPGPLHEPTAGHGGQDAPVRRGREVRAGGGGGWWPRAVGPGVARARVASHPRGDPHTG